MLKPVLFVVAAIYFAADAMFSALTRPIAAWLSRQAWLAGIRRWIASLRPYPALALFAVPLAVLEPVKPVAAYLTATGHLIAGAATFVVGELLKLVLVERLFQINKHKLLSIPAFAWCYQRYRMLMAWLASFEVWQATRRRVAAISASLREILAHSLVSWRREAAAQRISQRRSRLRITTSRSSE